MDGFEQCCQFVFDIGDCACQIGWWDVVVGLVVGLIDFVCSLNSMNGNEEEDCDDLYVFIQVLMVGQVGGR